MNIIKKMILEFNSSIVTRTETKDNIERIIYSIVKEISPASSSDYGMALVGPPSDTKDVYGSIKKHIIDFKSIGIKEEKLIIVDCDDDVYNSLKSAKDYNEFKYHLRKGFFNDELKYFLSSGDRLAFADCDGTMKLSSSETELVDLFATNSSKIGCLRIVSNGRGSSDKKHYANISKNLKMGIFYRPVYMESDIIKLIINSENTPENEKQRFINMNKKSLRELRIVKKDIPPEEDILSEYARSKGLDTLVFSYSGKDGSNMKSFLFSRKNLDKYKKIYGSILGIRSFNNAKENMVKMNISGNNINVLLPGIANSISTLYYLINNKIYHKNYGFISSYNKVE